MSDFDAQNITNIHDHIMADPTTWADTVSRHLCEIAESLLRQAQAVADIRWQSIDIAELPEQEMLEFADKIPVLVTATKTLYYPFSIMDIMALS
ncbi:MAG: glutaredoxin family protein [Moraxella osloensis]